MSETLMVGGDVGGTRIKFVVLAGDGTTQLQGKVRTDPTDPRISLHRLAERVKDELGPISDRLQGVGLACAGIVSNRTGRLGRSPNLPGWEGMDLGEAITEAFGEVAVVVANDVNSALYGEWRLGAGMGCHNLVMIALGTGVGGGVLVHGQLVTGAANGAGEIGHMVLDPDGPTCSCGNRGCLEAYAGGWGLLHRARELARASSPASDAFAALVHRRSDELTTIDLFELAEAGDDTAQGLFQAAGRRLGQAVGNVVNLLDPERVLIGGGVAQAGRWLLKPCRETMAQLVLSEGSRQVPVVPAALGPFAAALGAAVMAREQEAIG